MLSDAKRTFKEVVMLKTGTRGRVIAGAVAFMVALVSWPASALADSGEVKLTPEASKLPGGKVLETLTNGAAGLLLVVCLLALVVAAGIWAVSHHSGNPQHASRARSGVIVCIAAALLITAGPALINFASHLGSTVK